jgi:3-deoxy-D-arabino-heptulosonate 7-phosphate (DAHP) synthase class II
MKKILIISIVILCAENLSAQTWAEWFRQKATQRKYLLQQIAALQVYSGYLSKGYSIAKNGLNTIKGFKNGDLLQHTNYFASLVTVNPKIKRYSKVAEIIALQITITKQSGNALKNFRKNRHFTTTEINYLQTVFNKLLSECAKNLDELFSLITNGTLQMKDDERIRAIDKIYIDMQDKQQFVRVFSNSAAGLSIQRSNEANDIIISKKINGLK